jgi:hypothetical protein
MAIRPPGHCTTACEPTVVAAPISTTATAHLGEKEDFIRRASRFLDLHGPPLRIFSSDRVNSWPQ